LDEAEAMVKVVAAAGAVRERSGDEPARFRGGWRSELRSILHELPRLRDREARETVQELRRTGPGGACV